jgi:hypothetical protein
LHARHIRRDGNPLNPGNFLNSSMMRGLLPCAFARSHRFIHRASRNRCGTSSAHSRAPACHRRFI